MDITHFNELNLPEALNHTLEHMGFTTPTPVQAQAIPYALAGKDILGSAQTGTGKTGAFGIPLVTHLLRDARSTALVMTPTRELATQVLEQLQKMLGKRSKIKTALLIGGESMPKQMQQLRNSPRLLVGTPGRINDHLERGTLMLYSANFLVLDETDRMLDMGFTEQIEKIIKFMPPKRQTMLFSATLPKNIIKIANSYLKDPVRVAVKAESMHADNIEHEVIQLAQDEKYSRLCKELDARAGSVIVFVKTKHGADKMAARLSKSGHDATAIHGDLRQNKRDRVIAGFRNKKYRILVATDVAARGLDIPHIEHVINYDLPQVAEDYVHRIGRTARAGAEGSAVCFITPADKGQWREIERLMYPDAKRERSDQKEEKAYKPRRRPRRNNGGRSGGNNRKEGRKEGDGPRGDGPKPNKPRPDKKRNKDKSNRSAKDGGNRKNGAGGGRKPRRRSFGKVTKSAKAA